MEKSKRFCIIGLCFIIGFILCHSILVHIESFLQGTEKQELTKYVHFEENETIIETDDEYYIITKYNDKYKIYLFGGERIVFTMLDTTLFHTKKFDNNLIQFSFSTGSPGPTYAFYFNTLTYQVSDLYENSKILDNEYVYFIEYLYNNEDDTVEYNDALKRLTVRDIFNDQSFYFTIYREFQWGWSPVEVIEDIKLNKNEKKLYIKYYTKDSTSEPIEEVFDIYWINT